MNFHIASRHAYQLSWNPYYYFKPVDNEQRRQESSILKEWAVAATWEYKAAYLKSALDEGAANYALLALDRHTGSYIMPPDRSGGAYEFFSEYVTPLSAPTPAIVRIAVDFATLALSHKSDLTRIAIDNTSQPFREYCRQIDMIQSLLSMKRYKDFEWTHP